MYSGRPIRNSNIAIGCIITIVAAICIIADSFIIGRDNFFLVLNADLGSFADIFFAAFTWLGDGVVWVPVAAAVIIYRKRFLPLLISAIVFSTAIAQLTKNYLFPDAPRPTAAITNMQLIHTVKGVELHTAYSFPSGHTTTAFTIFLLGCLWIDKRWIIPAGFIYALLVGYSRIYLAQHFPLDVGGGMIAAVLTIGLSVFVQKQWDKKEPANRIHRPIE